MVVRVMSRNLWIVMGGLIAVAAVGFQLKSMADLRREVASLRSELRGIPAETSPADSRAPRADASQANLSAGLQARLANLERNVASLAKTADTLMERGVIPPSEERVAQMQQRFFDSTASDGDRLRSLRVLRRNQQVTDEVAAQAVTWLQSSTNQNTRREVLQQLDGATNAALKQPLVAMLQTETFGNVREQLVEVLSNFAGDPAVEGKLWEVAMNDADEDVREEAQDALTEGRMTPERVERLRQKATDPAAPLDERLLSLRGLREANAQAPEAVAEMANLAQNSTDPVMRAKLFRAFDGINDPALMAPLVSGLQDPNPVVRENAADALGSFSGDPRVQEWLNHVIQNDADPRVKREAHSALEQSQRRARGERGR